MLKTYHAPSLTTGHGIHNATAYQRIIHGPWANDKSISNAEWQPGDVVKLDPDRHKSPVYGIVVWATVNELTGHQYVGVLWTP